MLTTAKTLRLAIAALLLAATAARAQMTMSTSTIAAGSGGISTLTSGWSRNNDSEKSWSKSLGNDDISAELELKAGIWDNSTKKGIYGDATGTVKLFSFDFEAAGVHAKSYNTTSSGKSSIEVVVADQSVWKQEFSASYEIASWSKNLSVSYSYNTIIWVIPVTAKVEVGCSIGLGLDLNVSLTGSGLEGYAAASAYGSASGGIGYSSSAFELSLTVRATLKVFDIRLELGAIVSVIGGATGAVTLDFDAVTIQLELVLKAKALCFEKEFALLIVEKSYGSLNYTFFSF